MGCYGILLNIITLERKKVEMTKRKLYYSSGAGIIALCLLAGIWFSSHTKSTTAVENVPLVRTKTVGVAEAAQGYSYSGEVRGRYESQLAFQVSGKIRKRNIELGSAVRPGDVLMQIDQNDMQQGVNASNAQVAAAESQLSLAEANLRRYKQLYEQNAISRMELDRHQTARDNAAAMMQAATAKYTESAYQLDYTNLRADCAGVIASINAEVGQVVGAGQSVLTLVQDGEREVEISVPENRIVELRKASQLKVKFWALPNAIVDGKIREISPIADKITRTYKVRISLLNPPQEMKLGMTATVIAANAGSQAAVYIPLSAVYQTGNIPNVWIVNNDVVSLRPVKIGMFGDGKVQVLEGLNNGDSIVTAGVHKLLEGQKVRTAGDVQ